MYWLYLIIFVTMVFVPDLVTGSFFGLSERSAEELAIFFLGGLGFIFYLVKENELGKDRLEKSKAQRDASRMSKDLTSSYSFIGEINRKLEIFKNISLGLPVWSKISKARERESFGYIMAAIKIITRADEYSLRFVNKDSFEVLFELKSKRSAKIDFLIEKCLEEDKKYFETGEFVVIVSPDDIKGVICIITIKKKNYASFSDDPDILKAIASQALFLYMYPRKERGSGFRSEHGFRGKSGG